MDAPYDASTPGAILATMVFAFCALLLDGMLSGDDVMIFWENWEMQH
ncbi:hypothetical protein [Caballeronia sp. EK]|nr:hypothetical protein [Caballeronia sp. EK]